MGDASRELGARRSELPWGKGVRRQPDLLAETLRYGCPRKRGEGATA